MNRNTQRRILLLGLAVSGVFLWYAVKDVSFAEVYQRLLSASLWMAIPFLLSLASFYWLKALRWKDLLAPTVNLHATQVLPSLMVGFAANNVLPARLGELVRIYTLGTEFSLAKATVLATVVLERIFDVFAVLLIAVTAILASDSVSAPFRTATIVLSFLAICAVLSVVVLTRRDKWAVQAVRPLFAILPDKIEVWLKSQLNLLGEGFATLRMGHVVARIVANSILQWILMVTCIYLAVVAFSVSVPLVASAVVMILIVAGISLPSSPGFVGAIEAAFVVGLGAFGVAPGTALSVAIFYHLLTWSSVTLSGLLFLRRYDKSLARISKDAQASRSV